MRWLILAAVLLLSVVVGVSLIGRPRQGKVRLSGAQPPTKAVTIPVEGMSCVSCTASVKKALKSMDGVTDVEVNLESRSARVEYIEGKVTPGQLVAAVNHLGYRAGTPKEEKTR